MFVISSLPSPRYSLACFFETVGHLSTGGKNRKVCQIAELLNIQNQGGIILEANITWDSYLSQSPKNAALSG